MKNWSWSFFVFIILLGACKPKQERASSNVNSEWALKQPYVVMVSIDGFRHDYAEMHDAKNILEIKESGAYTEGMIPSYPSKTFPNHYTLVTGMYPGTHGLVGNEFYSVSKDARYGNKHKGSVQNGDWYGGIPLWSLAEKNDMLSASYFWVGSEATIADEEPTYVYAYDESVPNGDRVDQVLDWLKMSEDVRPHMINLYFSDVDSKGHEFGPEADQTKTAVLEIDEQIGRLRGGIKELNLPVTIIITSDHGMTPINKGVYLDVDFEGTEMVYSSTHLLVYSEDDDIIEGIKSDADSVEGVVAIKRSEMPDDYKLDNRDKAGDLLIQVQPPAIFTKNQNVTGGTHGYDPYVYEDMHTIFYIEGDNIQKGLKIDKFQNVDVYPLVAKILGLEVKHEIDGSINTLKKVLKN